MFEPYKIRVADADEGVVEALDQEEGFVVEPPSVAAMGSKLFSIICVYEKGARLLLMSMFLKVSSILLFNAVVQWLGLNGLSAATSGLIFAFCSYLTWLRVARQLHTVSQVVVGAFVGTIFTILWLWLWHSIVLKAYVSHLKIRILVVVVAAGFCVAFALYVIRYWFMEEVSLHISRKLPS